MTARLLVLSLGETGRVTLRGVTWAMPVGRSKIALLAGRALKE